ncbi:MAG TPA: nuclear transport factor 2 family protein [Chloroflexota bacterium]|nr:nuclear transport factor 2 family protein [Chloroflexota bacterium]
MGRDHYGVRDEIKDTAESFYRAVTNKNLKGIDSVWAQVPYASVAGRSGHIRQGWPAVRGYWEERFAQLGPIKVVAKLQGLVVHAVGDVAWVSGTELRTISDGDIRHERLRMTAVLERKGDQWQIVSYHASEGAPRHESSQLAS